MEHHPYEQETQAIRELLRLTSAIEQLREELHECRSCLRSPRMDGMPRGCIDGNAMARQIIREEAIKRQLDAAERLLPEAKKAAADACMRLPAEMRAFCEIYYVDGLDYELARAFAGVSDRRCSRFMDMVEGE